MRKPNWKRQGLPKPVTNEDGAIAAQKKALERRVQKDTNELRRQFERVKQAHEYLR